MNHKFSTRNKQIFVISHCKLATFTHYLVQTVKFRSILEKNGKVIANIAETNESIWTKRKHYSIQNSLSTTLFQTNIYSPFQVLRIYWGNEIPLAYLSLVEMSRKCQVIYFLDSKSQCPGSYAMHMSKNLGTRDTCTVQFPSSFDVLRKLLTVASSLDQSLVVLRSFAFAFVRISLSVLTGIHAI